MTTIAFPAVSTPHRYAFGLSSHTWAQASPTNGAVQTLERPGAFWVCTMGWNQLTVAETALMRVFLALMRGQANRVNLFDFTMPAPSGTQRGSPLVNGGSQTGSTLNIDGCTNGNTFLRGDMIATTTGLHMVCADVTASGGAMALTIEPPIRTSPADNSAITWDRGTASFRLASDSWSLSYGAPLPKGWSGALDLTFIETLT